MKQRTPQKADQVYEMLRRSIILLEIEPGAALVEKTICAELSVSRTPVREAVQRLVEEDLVKVIPHSGTYVSGISFTTAEEGFVIRRALEIEGVRRAATHCTAQDAELLQQSVERMRLLLREGRLEHYLDEDDAFHSAIAHMSRMPRIWKFITMAKVHLDRMRQLSAPVPGHLATVTEQHADIAAALAAGKPDQAELAMRIHLEHSFDVMAGLYGELAHMFQKENG